MDEVNYREIAERGAREIESSIKSRIVMGNCYRCGSDVYNRDEDGWRCHDCGFVLAPEPEFDPMDGYDRDDPKRWM